MKSKPLEISIVGAGIGGLVAALALKKRGHKPTIYEKTESLSELGAGTVSYTHLTLPTK